MNDGSDAAGFVEWSDLQGPAPYLPSIDRGDKSGDDGVHQGHRTLQHIYRSHSAGSSDRAIHSVRCSGQTPASSRTRTGPSFWSVSSTLPALPTTPQSQGCLKNPTRPTHSSPAPTCAWSANCRGLTMQQANRTYWGLIGETCEVRTSVFSKAITPGQNRCMSRAAPLIFAEDEFRPGHARLRSAPNRAGSQALETTRLCLG